MSKLGFAIVGCGNIGPFHADAINQIEDAELVAVCDTAEEKAIELAQKYGATPFTDYAEMLSMDFVDVVNICLPSGLHEPLGVQAAKAGKHIIVEKPLDITLEKCDRIIECCERNKVKMAVVFPSRFKDASLELKRAVDNDRFGRITLGDAQVKWYRSQEYYDSGGWRGTWEYDGGGALMNQSVHYIDLLQSFMGPVESVYAHCETLARNIEVEDTAVATIKYQSDALGVIEGTTSVYPGLDVRIGIHGTKGSAVLEGSRIVCWEFDEKLPGDESMIERFSKTGSSGAKDPTRNLNSYGHQKQIEDMIRAIKTDTEPTVNGPEGRKAVEIILAIYQSSREGVPVKLPL